MGGHTGFYEHVSEDEIGDVIDDAVNQYVNIYHLALKAIRVELEDNLALYTVSIRFSK